MFTNPSDQLREAVNTGTPLSSIMGRFEAIYAKLKTQFVQEEIDREKELEQRREEIARLMADQKLTQTMKKGSNSNSKSTVPVRTAAMRDDKK